MRADALRLADALDAISAYSDAECATLSGAATLLRQWPEAGWMPIESAPKDVKAHFWLAPRPPEKCFKDTSGNPMYFGGEPYAVFDFYGRWSVLYEAQCWHPGPAAPGAAPSQQPAPKVPSEWRSEVVAFANLMERELRNNDHKGGWKNDAPGRLIERAEEEMRELFAAHLSYPRDTREYRDNLASEGADVANMVMMVLDVCGALPVEQAAQSGMVMVPMEELGDGISLLHQAMVGACDCLTKTHEAQYHAENCFYRKLSEKCDKLEAALAAAPQAVPQPLTDEQIIELARECDAIVYTNRHFKETPAASFSYPALQAFARAIEAAVLGITAKGEQK